MLPIALPSGNTASPCKEMINLRPNASRSLAHGIIPNNPKAPFEGTSLNAPIFRLQFVRKRTIQLVRRLKSALIGRVTDYGL